MKNILEYLEATAARTPDKRAFSDGIESLTFHEVLHMARAIGTALLKQGCKEAPIAILMKRHPNQIAAFYGVIYAGCCYVPLDPDMPSARMDSILHTTGVRVLITDSLGAKKAASLRFDGAVCDASELCREAIDEGALSSVRDRQIDTDPIYVVFTSGSTGTPKGVVACHRSVIDYTESLCRALPFDGDTVFGNQTPLFFDAPLKELMPTLKLGATTYLIPKMLFSFPVRLCAYLNEHGINTICWVVTALTNVSSLGALEAEPPQHLRLVAFGSELFPRAQYELWRHALPNADFYNLYGPTEATGMSFYWKADRALGEQEPIPVGRPFDNTGFFLLDEEGKEAKKGEQGEIYLRGTCVTMGYYNDPERSAEAFLQNPLRPAFRDICYRTGDMGYLNDRGELVFVCRKDRQIKHQGHRIELGEIEQAADLFPTVRQAACIYDSEGKRILLFYTGDADERALMTHLASRLPRYMIPAVLTRLARMPQTPNGKLDRRALTVK